MKESQEYPLIGIVGACASGKTTLIRGLKDLGYNCRHIAQEHSYVPDMWRRLTNPDILIFLEVGYETTLTRKNLNWTRTEFEQQLYRLRHAKEFAQIKIITDHLTPYELVFTATKEIQELIDLSH